MNTITIYTHNTILTLNNPSYSPYWNTMLNSGIGIDKDGEGNIIFPSMDYTLDEIKCYIEYCNDGYIDINAFNADLFDFMGHDVIYRTHPKYLILRLQYEWSIHSVGGHNIMYSLGQYSFSNDDGMKSCISAIEYYIKTKGNGREYIIKTNARYSEKDDDSKYSIIVFGSHSTSILGTEYIKRYNYANKAFYNYIKYVHNMSILEYMEKNIGVYHYNGRLYIPSIPQYYYDYRGNHPDIYKSYVKGKYAHERTDIFPDVKYYARLYAKALEPFFDKSKIKPLNIKLTKELFDMYEGVSIATIGRLEYILKGKKDKFLNWPKIKRATSSALYILEVLHVNFDIREVIQEEYETLDDMLNDVRLEM